MPGSPVRPEDLPEDMVQKLAEPYRTMILAQRAMNAERMAQRLIGGDSPPTQPVVSAPAGPDIKFNLDLGKLLHDALDMAKGGGSTPEGARLQATLEGIAAQLKGGATSPLETYRQISELVMSIKKDLGGGAELGNAGVAQLPLLVELEKVKGEREDRQRQHEQMMGESANRWKAEQTEQRNRWEAEKEDQRRRWVVEDRKWQEDMRQGQARLRMESEKQEQLVGVLGDLFGSATDGLEDAESVGHARPARGERPKVVDAEVRETETAQPLGFTCPECKTKIEVSQEAKAGDQVACPSCGSNYTYKEPGEGGS